MLYALSGTPPFGEADGKQILARQLTGTIDVSDHPPQVAAWLRTALSPRPDDRFTDATAMQAAWREAIEAEFAAEGRRPWWRRWLTAAAGEQLWTVDQNS